MSKTTVAIAIIVILIVAGVALFKGSTQAPTDDTTATTTVQTGTISQNATSTGDMMMGTSTPDMTK